MQVPCCHQNFKTGWVQRRWLSPDFSRAWDLKGLRGMAVLSPLVGCLLCQPQICWFSLCSVSFLTAPHTLLLQCLNFIARFKWRKPSCSTVHIMTYWYWCVKNMRVIGLKYYGGWMLYLLSDVYIIQFLFQQF